MNLSGNFIERIPESIDQLYSLKVFRIARNKLSQINDLKYLGRLKRLRTLRIEDNPICFYNNIRSYTLQVIPNIRMLNGVVVSKQERLLTALHVIFYYYISHSFNDFYVERMLVDHLVKVGLKRPFLWTLMPY